MESRGQDSGTDSGYLAQRHPLLYRPGQQAERYYAGQDEIA
jgi:hypothetical protein